MDQTVLKIPFYESSIIFDHHEKLKKQRIIAFNGGMDHPDVEWLGHLLPSPDKLASEKDFLILQDLLVPIKRVRKPSTCKMVFDPLLKKFAYGYANLFKNIIDWGHQHEPKNGEFVIRVAPVNSKTRYAVCKFPSRTKNSLLVLGLVAESQFQELSNCRAEQVQQLEVVLARLGNAVLPVFLSELPEEVVATVGFTKMVVGRFKLINGYYSFLPPPPPQRSYDLLFPDGPSRMPRSTEEDEAAPQQAPFFQDIYFRLRTPAGDQSPQLTSLTESSNANLAFETPALAATINHSLEIPWGGSSPRAPVSPMPLHEEEEEPFAFSPFFESGFPPSSPLPSFPPTPEVVLEAVSAAAVANHEQQQLAASTPLPPPPPPPDEFVEEEKKKKEEKEEEKSKKRKASPSSFSSSSSSEPPQKRLRLVHSQLAESACGDPMIIDLTNDPDEVEIKSEPVPITEACDAKITIFSAEAKLTILKMKHERISACNVKLSELVNKHGVKGIVEMGWPALYTECTSSPYFPGCFSWAKIEKQAAEKMDIFTDWILHQRRLALLLEKHQHLMLPTGLTAEDLVRMREMPECRHCKVVLSTPREVDVCLVCAARRRPRDGEEQQQHLLTIDMHTWATGLLRHKKTGRHKFSARALKWAEEVIAQL